MQTNFDTLAYAEALKSAGVPEEQARIHAQTLRGLLDSDLATKRDIRELELVTKREIRELELVTKREIRELELKIEQVKSELEIKIEHGKTSLEARIMETKSEMIKWVAGMLVAQAVVVATLVKLL